MRCSEGETKKQLQETFLAKTADSPDPLAAGQEVQRSEVGLGGVMGVQRDTNGLVLFFLFLFFYLKVTSN